MNKLHLVTNYLIFLSFLSLTSTGLLLEFRLPRQSGGAEILGFTRHDWGNIHFYISVVALTLIALHLYLNRSWFKSLILKMSWPVFLTSIAITFALVLIPFIV